MRRIYFDTNQIYYIRRIADEAQGWDYGNYEWAYLEFASNPDLVNDIRALCYIVALQWEWELDFSPSSAAFREVSQSANRRALASRDAWAIFVEGLSKDQHLRRGMSLADKPRGERLGLESIADPDDRAILRDFAREGSDVLLTLDRDILDHKSKLAELGLTVMRPSEWLNTFLADFRDGHEAVDWPERVLFGMGN